MVARCWSKYGMTPLIRVAVPANIPAMHGVRLAVRENRLRSSVITEKHYIPFIEEVGRSWVVVEDGAVLGFAAGHKTTGNIWALFVDPAQEGRGLGFALHAAMVGWLFEQDLRRLGLDTEPGTRAQRFYGAAGWSFVHLSPDGEALYALRALSTAQRIRLISAPKANKPQRKRYEKGRR